MKCAISVPDDVFSEVDGQAARLGISRSEFFTRAARRYLEHVKADGGSAAVDVILTSIGVTGPPEDAAWAADSGPQSLGRWAWADDVTE